MIERGSQHCKRGPVPRRLKPLARWRVLTSPYLTAEAQHALADAVSVPRTVAAQTDLVREGDPADQLFIVLDGWACRYATTLDGGRQLPALLVSGDVCNLDSLIFDQLDYGVRTLSSATVIALARDRAAALAAAHADIAQMFTRLAMVENTILSRWAVSLGRRSARARLAHLLCELSIRLDAQRNGASRYDFPLTQEYLGDALGLTPVHVNRTIRQLRDDGLIQMDQRTVAIADLARLEAVGGFDQAYLHMEPVTPLTVEGSGI